MDAPAASTVPFPYDLPRLLWLRERIRSLGDSTQPALDLLHMPPVTPRRVGILAGSFNPLTRGHVALVEAAEADAVVLLLPLRAVDKEGVTRAAAEDRALVLLEWARRRDRVGVALVNQGLYVEQAALLAAQYPHGELIFLTGHDKIVQIFDPRYYAERDAALRELFRLARVRVAPRAGRSTQALHALLAEPQNRPFASAVGALALGEDVDALSSTLVRAAVDTGEPWEDMVPEETVLFMREALPYSPPRRLPDGEEIDAYGLRLALIEVAATGRLDPSGFMESCRTAREATPEGRRLRALLAQYT